MLRRKRPSKCNKRLFVCLFFVVVYWIRFRNPIWKYLGLKNYCITGTHPFPKKRIRSGPSSPPLRSTRNTLRKTTKSPTWPTRRLLQTSCFGNVVGLFTMVHQSCNGSISLWSYNNLLLKPLSTSWWTRVVYRTWKCKEVSGLYYESYMIYIWHLTKSLFTTICNNLSFNE